MHIIWIKKLLPTRKWILPVGVMLIIFLVWCHWARWRPAHRFVPGELKPGEFRLVTWNVGYFTAMSNKNSRDVDIPTIADVLHKLSPQVVILQELGSVGQADKIAKKLGKNWHDISSKTGHKGQVTTILTRLKAGDVDVMRAGDRMVLGVPVYLNGQSIFIVGVHAPHPGRGLKHTTDNIRAALSMIEKRKEPIRIMAGDFNYNFDPENEAKDSECLYGEITGELADSTASIGETYYAHTRIDHVFHYPQTLKVIEESSGMVDLPMRFANVPGFRDHRPIVITYDVGDSNLGFRN